MWIVASGISLTFSFVVSHTMPKGQERTPKENYMVMLSEVASPFLILLFGWVATSICLTSSRLFTKSLHGEIVAFASFISASHCLRKGDNFE